MTQHTSSAREDTNCDSEWNKLTCIPCSLPCCEDCHSSLACLTYTYRLVKGTRSARNNALRQAQFVRTVMNDESRFPTTGYFTLAEYRATHAEKEVSKGEEVTKNVSFTQID